MGARTKTRISKRLSSLVCTQQSTYTCSQSLLGTTKREVCLGTKPSRVHVPKELINNILTLEPASGAVPPRGQTFELPLAIFTVHESQDCQDVSWSRVRLDVSL